VGYNDDVIGNRELRQAVKEHFQRNDMFAMYYTLHQGAAVGTSTVNIPCAYGIGPTLQSSTITGDVISPNADTAQWTAKNGYWSGNQIDRVLLGNYTTELDWDTKLAVRDGAMLVCCQVEEIPIPSQDNMLWVIGYTGASGQLSQVYLRQVIANGVRVAARNDALTDTAHTTVNFDNISQTVINHFTLLDNRPSGKQLISWWGDTSRTRVIRNGLSSSLPSTSFFSFRPVVSGEEPDPTRLKIAVGARYIARPKELTTNPALNAIRRLRIFNFKQNLPANLTEIMQGLNQHNLLDCPELLTI